MLISLGKLVEDGTLSAKFWKHMCIINDHTTGNTISTITRKPNDLTKKLYILDFTYVNKIVEEINLFQQDIITRNYLKLHLKQLTLLLIILQFLGVVNLPLN